MWLINLIPAPLRIYAALLMVAGLVGFGWYAHVVYTGYVAGKDKTDVIENLKEGQTKIIQFNQDFDKGLANAKDDCVNKPMPDSIRVLLSGH